MRIVSNGYRQAAALVLVGLTAFSALAFQPAPTRAQDTTEAAKADVAFVPIPGNGFDFVLSPDGRYAATFEMAVLAEDRKVVPDLLPIHLVDIPSAKELRTFSGMTDYTVSAAFNSNGSQLASFEQNGDLFVWNTATGKAVKSYDTGIIGGGRLAFLPGNRTLVAGIYDAFRPHLQLYDTQTGNVTGVLVPHADNYADLIAGSGAINQNAIAALALSPDGKTLAVSTIMDEVWVWNLTTKEATKLVASDVQYPSLSILKLAFTADGKKLVYFRVLKDKEKLHVWTLADSSEQTLDIGGRAWALAPDGDTIAWANRDETTVEMAKISAPDEVTSIDIGREVPSMPTLAYTKDGKRLVLGLWNPTESEDGTNGLYIVTLP